MPLPPSLSGARFVRECGFDGCVELVHATTRVVLDPNVGGRVLRYSHAGVDALHREPAQDGVRWSPHAGLRHPAGGRFDLGPEYGGLAREEIWFGRWQAEITGPRAARLTSATMPESGLQVVREFALDEDSRLHCTQIIRNHGGAPLRAFHWSRTFLPGGGTALAPLPAAGRFPRGYALGGPPGVVDFLPEAEPMVRVRDGTLEVCGLPRRAKFILDVEPGWLAYAGPNQLLFLKTFAVNPGRAYGELAANNASIWYGGKENTPDWPLSGPVAEIEAIGPLEAVAPGGSLTFTEHWQLLPIRLDTAGHVDLSWLRTAAAESAAP
jgi:hypothetical protein